LPPAEPTYQVLSVGLPGYLDGIYPVNAMHTLEPLPAHLKSYPSPAAPNPLPESPDAALDVDAVLIQAERAVPKSLKPGLQRNFTHVYTFKGHVQVYVRKAARSASKP
jgi:hypothetical protein